MTDAPAAATRAYMPPAQSVEWETPADLFAALEREFGPFELDPAATAANAKAPHWYGPGSVEAPDGLNESWLWAKRIYINPPYGGGAQSVGREGRARSAPRLPRRDASAGAHRRRVVPRPRLPEAERRGAVHARPRSLRPQRHARAVPEHDRRVPTA